jgi:hypothetical protein
MSKPNRQRPIEGYAVYQIISFGTKNLPARFGGARTKGGNAEFWLVKPNPLVWSFDLEQRYLFDNRQEAHEFSRCQVDTLFAMSIEIVYKPTLSERFGRLVSGIRRKLARKPIIGQVAGAAGMIVSVVGIIYIFLDL